jgi:hypothetical protein
MKNSISVFFLVFVFLACFDNVSAATITLDQGTTFQTMTGWEHASYIYQESPAFDNFKDEVYDRSVEAGINRIRLGYRSGSENVDDYWTLYTQGQIDYTTWRCHRYATLNDNADPDVIDWNGFYFSELDDTVNKIVLPMKQRVEANGEKYHINLNHVAFTSQMRDAQCPPGLQYIHDDPDEYAELILAIFLHLESTFSFVPDTVEMVLEPDNVPEWNGNLIGQAIVATANKLNANGFYPRFVVPCTTNMGNAVSYFDQINQVPGAVQHIQELCYHRYGGVSDPNLQAIVNRATQYNLNTSMLEWWSGSNTYQTLHKDLKMGMNSAWQQGTLAGTSTAVTVLFQVDDTDPYNPIVNMNSKTRFNRQYFKFVRAGAVRIDASSDDGNFDPLALINTDGRYVAVVKADGGGTFSVLGLPAGIYGIKYTTSSQYDVDLPDQTIGSGQFVTTNIPAIGVITIYGKTPLQSCSDLGGVECCSGSKICPGSNLGPSSDCSGICCSQGCTEPPPTCQNQGYLCCNRCQSGTGQPAHDSDCPGQSCCGACGTTPVCDNLLLLHHYDQDPSYGETATHVYDFSGNGNNGTVSGATHNPSNGKFQGSYDIDSDGEAITVANDPSINFGSGEDFTISVWARSDNSDTEQILLGKRGANAGYKVYFSPSSQFFRLHEPPSTLINTPFSFPYDGQWHHVVAMRNSSHASVWIDGTLQGMSSHNNADLTDTVPLKIGGELGWDPGSMLGSVDELAIWNRSLSSQEVQELYTSDSPVDCAIQYHRADTNQDSCIVINELLSFIDLWHYDSASYPMMEMMDAIGLWKGGQGCT